MPALAERTVITPTITSAFTASSAPRKPAEHQRGRCCSISSPEAEDEESADQRAGTEASAYPWPEA